MRKITEEAVRAFWNGKNLRKGNTEVVSSNYGSQMFLHGNEIANLDKRFNVLLIDNCGWETPTTKERLNGILEGVSGKKYLSYLYQEKGVWYYSFCHDKKKRVEFPCNEWVEIDLETGEIKTGETGK